MNPYIPYQPTVPPMVESTPDVIETGGFHVTILPDNVKDPDSLSVDIVDPPKKRGRPRKQKVNDNEIIRSDADTKKSLEGDVVPTSYTYQETTDILRGTVAQIDELSFQVRQELETVRASRTMRNKHTCITNLVDNLATLTNAKISAIREINSSITKANDLDYKRIKDMKAVQTERNDDKYIMDLYSAFVQGNPNAILPNGGAALGGPAPIDATLGGDGIIRSDLGQAGNGAFVDAGYLSYVSNMTPEQNLMLYENDPNVKQVVVYDKSTGNKFFQIMDMSSMQVIPNVPVRSQSFMEETTIDLDHMIAKNTLLNETYPVVVINDDIVKEY